MKRSILTIMLILFVNSTFSQTISLTNRLYFTAKVYGYVKYYHSEVSTCKLDWDSIVASYLPAIKASDDITQLNLALNGMLDAAGQSAVPTSPMPEPIQTDLKINIDDNWYNDPQLDSNVKAKIDSIRVRFRPHPSCYVQDNDYTGNYYGWLVFPKDSVMFKNYVINVYPSENERIMSMFRYWNIIRYFNPYNDILDISWDSVFKKNILYIVNSKNSTQFYHSIRRFASGLNDVHAEGLTNANYISPPTYYYSPEIILSYAEGNYVVAASNVTGVTRGAILNSVNNISVKNMEDSLRPYLSYGNEDVFHRTMCRYMLNGYPNSLARLNITDTAGNTQFVNLQRKTYIYEDFFYTYYPNDTLKDVSYKKINCEIGYVNMGVITRTEIAKMYEDFKDSRAIIFDIRNYPQGTVFDIADYIFPNELPCAKFKVPDVQYPGTFYYETSSFGLNNNTDSYKGQVYILVNQETQSHAEYSAMILKAMPGAIIVGSPTAAADGNITYFRINRDLGVGYTGIGVYYPDGSPTQRIGIVPDTLVRPSVEGIKKGLDEVLNVAIRMAGCWTSEINQPIANRFNIYPNPSEGLINISTPFNSDYTIRVLGIDGKIILESIKNTNETLDLNSLNQGMYIVEITQGGNRFTQAIFINR